MCFMKILSIILCLVANTPDTVFKIQTRVDTIYVTTTDIVYAAVSNFDMSCHLSKEMSDSLLSLKYDSCQVFVKNGEWIFLQEYELRAAHIPEGYYIWTDFGTIMYKEGWLHVGYNYPYRIKKKRNYGKRYLTVPMFQQVIITNNSSRIR